jgi:hypothetical protein
MNEIILNNSKTYDNYFFSDKKANSSDDEEAPLLVSETQEKIADFSQNAFQKSETLLSLEENNQKQKFMQSVKKRAKRNFLLNKFVYEKTLEEQLKHLCKSERYEDFLYLDSVCEGRNLLIIEKIFRKFVVEKGKEGSNKKFISPDIYKIGSPEEIFKASKVFLGWCKSNKEGLSKLSSLDLREENLSELPVGILEFLPNLVKLKLSYNNILSLPTEIKNLKNLKILDITDNHLKELPEEILTLENLEELNLAQNEISTIPEGISKLKCLKDLDICKNKLTFVPKEIGQLENLQRLVLRDNKLTEVPSEIATLKKLKILDLSNNLLETIPFEIMQMKLTYFNDSFNTINNFFKKFIKV